jgi:hypothetical protein
MVGSICYYGKILLFARIYCFQNPAKSETAMHNLRSCGECGFGRNEGAESIIYKEDLV